MGTGTGTSTMDWGDGGDSSGDVIDRARVGDSAAMYGLFCRVPSSVNHLCRCVASMVMAMLMLAGAGDEVHQMVTAMECAKWGRLATAMKCVKWRQQWLRWITAAGNSDGVRRMATSNGNGNGGVEWRRLAAAMKCVKW